MDQDRTDVLLARYLAGELSPEESEELEWAFLANPALRDSFQVLQRMREVSPVGLSSREEQEMLERGIGRWKEPKAYPLYKEEQKVRKLSPRWWMAAASVLILGVAGVLFYNGYKKNVASVRPLKDKEIATRYGTRSFLELPDGSKLWLNAGSRVKYIEDFADGKRELTLAGEAFFDVKHDPDHPFIIHTDKLDVKVLGTSFNVKAYQNDPTMETTLINGKVEIDFPGDDRANIVLRPNEKVVIPVNGSPVAGPVKGSVAPDSIYRTLIETSWVEDKLVFRNEAFSDVTTKLERWYNIRFSFKDSNYLQDRLTGYFKDQPIKNVMDALQISLGFHYRIEGDTIRIW